MTDITVRDVSLRRRNIEVLSRVSLEAVGGEIVGIVGPNGAGKTTLLEVIAGDLEPDFGTVELGGVPVADRSLADLAQLRAYLAPGQTADLLFTVRDVVAMGRHPYEAAGSVLLDDSVVAAAMADADVAHLADRPVRHLSTGERQRVGLARVLAQRTPVVLLDEPTSSLDLGHQEMVMGTVRSLAAAGGTVVVVMHDLNLAAAHAHRMVLLDRGRVVAHGSPSAVLTAETLTAAYHQPVVVVPHPHRDCPLVLTVDAEQA